MTQSQENKSLKWFAARVIRERAYVDKMLKVEKVETSGIRDIPTLLFIHCTGAKIEELRRLLWDRVLFYRNPERTAVQPIPDSVMTTFLIMAPYHDEPVIYLAVDDPHFFEGPRKRIKSGLFAGCEGVIRRLKGNRRLIVRISDRAAIATPYIPHDLLEDIE